MAEPEKHPGGRPTKYDPAFIRKVDKYLADNSDEEEQELVGLSAKGTELYKTKLRVRLPTIEGFARYLKVNKSSLYEWESLYPEFSDALEKIKTEQQQRLINEGLSGAYNPTIAKLILSANHDMKEKSEHDLTSKGKRLGSLHELDDQTLQHIATGGDGGIGEEGTS